MAGGSSGIEGEIELTTAELREVAGFAAAAAGAALDIFEAAHPDDPRPRRAIEEAGAFAAGGPRNKQLRDTAWAAQRAARDASSPAAAEAARAAMLAASAGYLHPLRDAHQVKHILGAAAFAAAAAETAAGGVRQVGAEHLRVASRRAAPVVVDVLSRFPPAPAGGGRAGELLRELDAMLRGRAGTAPGSWSGGPGTGHDPARRR